MEVRSRSGDGALEITSVHRQLMYRCAWGWVRTECNVIKGLRVHQACFSRPQGEGGTGEG